MYKTDSFVIFFITVHLFWFCDGFSVYWNVPTEQCQKYGIQFDLSTYHIIQNSEDKFHGDRINIIYRPGRFPYFKDDEPVWGGIPQRADVQAHIEQFVTQIHKEIPLNFSGYVVLDFEDYQPNYDISHEIYKNASREWIKGQHPNWPNKTIELMARKTFNEAALMLFQVLMRVGKPFRPDAKWGYYHYPYCVNPIPGSPACKSEQVKANEEMSSFFNESDALYPSIYIFKEGWNVYTSAQQVLARLLNTLQIRGLSKSPVLPYFWFKFHDSVEEYLETSDLWITLGLVWSLKLDGAIIWGSSNDVRSKDICLELKEYVTTTLGPFVKFLTEHSLDRSSNPQNDFHRLQSKDRVEN